MQKYFRHFFKLLLVLFLAIFLFTVIISIYITVNQEKITAQFLKNIEDEVDFEMDYSNFSISLISHFPFADFTFKDLTVKYPKTFGGDTLLSAKSLSLTINTINLLRGQFNLRSCIIETGETNYYPAYINSIIAQYQSNETKQEGKSNYISVKKFILNNYDLNIYDDQNSLSLNLSIDKTLIFFDLNKYVLNLSFKSELKNFKSKKLKSLARPITIQGNLKGNDGIYNIENLSLKSNSIEFILNGTYNQKSGCINLKYRSNQFSVKKLLQLYHSKVNLTELSGNLKVNGFLEYNINGNYMNKLLLNHSSRLFLRVNKSDFNIDLLDGSTEFTKNFEQHLSKIKKLDFNYKEFTGNLSAKINGIKNPIVLAEGLVGINNANYSLLGKSIKYNASGKIKILFGLSDFSSIDSLKVNIHNIDGALNFNIDNIQDVDRIEKLEGTIDLGNNIAVNAKGKFDGQPFIMEILQTDLINCFTDKQALSPQISVNAELIDVDYIEEFLNNVDFSSEQETSKDKFTIKLNSKNLKYSDYIFNNVTSTLIIYDDIFEIQNFAGKGFDGELDGYLKNSNDKYLIYTNFSKININKLFTHFKNFNQSVVLSENISGFITGNASLNYNTNDNGDIIYPSIKLESDITINDGKLKGMNKIEKLSKWLKLDQVESIDFKTLHNKILISEGCVRIPKMEVHSNVVNLQLSGEHYFAGNYTYWMKINFSQVLSRRFLNFSSSRDFDNSSNGSINLYLKMMGDFNDYNVTLDKSLSLEKFKGDLQAEGKTIKELFKSEYQSLKNKDTISVQTQKKDSTLNKFTIEWDEYDTLKVDNY